MPSWGCPNQYVETPPGSNNWIPDYSAGERRRRRRRLRQRPGARLDRAVRADHALRDRHQPQRPRAARRHAVRRRALQPAGGGARARSHAGNWCNPPGAGLGVRPTANTGVALLDANLWVKVPGESDGSCDIAGGARAWDFGAYNPWGARRPTPRPTSTRCGGWSIRTPARGSPSRRSSSPETRRLRCSEATHPVIDRPRLRALRRPGPRYTISPCRRRSASAPTSTRWAISRAPSRSSSRASSAATRRRCCSASPAAARRSRSRSVIERIQRPTLIIAHNKTLAPQLYGEFKDALPRQRRPLLRQLLRLLPARGLRPVDRHVHREGLDHQRGDRSHAPRGDVRAALAARRDHRRVGVVHLRHRRGRGLPGHEARPRASGVEVRRDAVLRRLVEIQYERNDVDFHRGTFRVRGDIVEIFPAYEREKAIRIEWFGDEIEAITEVDPLRGKVLRKIDEVSIFPGSHYVTPAERLTRAMTRHQGRAARAARRAQGGQQAGREAAPRSSARCTTSRCSSRWAAARASRTTRATCRGARRASRRRR